MRLVCFASAERTTGLYTGWRALLPEWLTLSPIELPGRGARSHEPPIGSMPALVERLLPEIPDEPLATFGHSLGAKIAFEIARHRRPLHLFVAASPSHRFPSWGKELHRKPREELLAELIREGTPTRVLEDERLVDLLLPMVRADFQLAVEYEPPSLPTPDCPITAFAGTRDPDITIDDVASWARHTRGAFRLRPLEAGHHFVCETAAEVVGELVRAMEDA